MLSEVLENTDSRDSRQAICEANDTCKWYELRRLYKVALGNTHLAAGARVAYPFPASPQGFAALAALEKLNANVFLFDFEVDDQKLRDAAGELRLDVITTAEQLCADGLTLDVNRAEQGGGVTILTSGTAGKAKAVHHSFASLARPVRATPPGQRWLLAYRPHLYAGLQVALQALTNHGTVVVPGARMNADEIVDLMVSQSVEFASATPSYWRRLLMSAGPAALSQIPIRQITLGGEVVDQTILDQLRGCFPQARIVHIYATSETGRCFSVSDGEAGFPTSLIESPTNDGVAIRISDGELQVKSANAMSGYDQTSAVSDRITEDGWFRTGDLVESKGQRIFFCGRASDIINVGGNKVHPVEVEKIVRELDEVAEVRVYPQTSSIAGELVACDVVPTETHGDEQALREKILGHCNASLNRYQRPRIVRILPELPLSDAGKLKRR